MNDGDPPGGPGPGSVVVGSIVGVVISLGFGLLVAALANTWLLVDWVRGVASLAADAIVAAAMLRVVFQSATGRWRALRRRGPREG